MFGRGFGLNAVLPLTVLLLSIGIDLRGVTCKPPAFAALASTSFPLPGPRRYPPGYHGAGRHAAAFFAPADPDNAASHQTVINN